MEGLQHGHISHTCVLQAMVSRADQRARFEKRKQKDMKDMDARKRRCDDADGHTRGRSSKARPAMQNDEQEVNEARGRRGRGGRGWGKAVDESSDDAEAKSKPRGRGGRGRGGRGRGGRGRGRGKVAKDTSEEESDGKSPAKLIAAAKDDASAQEGLGEDEDEEALSPPAMPVRNTGRASEKATARKPSHGRGKKIEIEEGLDEGDGARTVRYSPVKPAKPGKAAQVSKPKKPADAEDKPRGASEGRLTFAGRRSPSSPNAMARFCVLRDIFQSKVANLAQSGKALSSLEVGSGLLRVQHSL